MISRGPFQAQIFCNSMKYCPLTNIWLREAGEGLFQKGSLTEGLLSPLLKIKYSSTLTDISATNPNSRFCDSPDKAAENLGQSPINVSSLASEPASHSMTD